MILSSVKVDATGTSLVGFFFYLCGLYNLGWWAQNIDGQLTIDE